MSTDAEPFDCWAPFKTVNALSPDIPKRGQGEPSPAVLLIGRLAYRGITLAATAGVITAHPAEHVTDEDRAAIEEHRAALVSILTPEQERPRPSLDEQVEAEAALALQTMGREPTAKETEQAKADARALLEWMGKNWHGTMTEPEFFEGLEAEFYRVGILSTLWGLRADRDALRELLTELRRIEDRAGPDFLGALHKAQSREGQEWQVVALAIGNMESQATALRSPRLAEAAKVMRAMLTADRLRPEAPAERARRESSRKAIAARHAGTGELKTRILSECMKHRRGMQWKNSAAQKVAPDAFKWNAEAGRPFSWLDVAATEKQVRRWLAGL